MPLVFVTGIDTDAGKSISSGLLARYLKDQKESVITQKLVQTGCEKRSEDIVKHREIMGIELSEFDKNGTTCPYLFSYPASPHLSAEMEGKNIDFNYIQSCTQTLLKNFKWVILEGAGGLMVPLNNKTTTLDYIQQNRYPVILVSTSKLGSINHTFLSLEALKSKKIRIIGIIFNHLNSEDPLITENSKKTIKKFYPDIPLVEIPYLNDIQKFGRIDFSPFFDR